MKGIYRDGYYDGSIESRDVFSRRCVTCGRGDFAQSRRMRIRKGIVIWNLVFSLMFTCVTGTSLCGDSPNFLTCACARARARNQKLYVPDVSKTGSHGLPDGTHGLALNAGFD